MWFNSIMQTKTGMRKQILEVLAAMDADEAIRLSAAACALVVETPQFFSAETIMAYMPIRVEIDCTDIITAAMSAGKTVSVPRVRSKQRQMDVVVIRSLDDDMSRGAFDIREPSGGEIIPPGRLDLIITPGVAFDRAGNRLGRGGGYYDRFLTQTARATSCALAFSQQIVEAVPVGPDDRRVDMLVTDREVLYFT